MDNSPELADTTGEWLDPKKIFKKPWFWILAFILTIVVVILLYFAVPAKNVSPLEFDPHGSFGAMVLRVRPSDKRLAVAFDAAGFNRDDVGFFKRLAYNLVKKRFIPNATAAWAMQGADDPLPSFAAMVKDGDIVKLLRLASVVPGPRVLKSGEWGGERIGGTNIKAFANADSWRDIGAFAFVGDSIVVGDRATSVASVPNSLRDEPESPLAERIRRYVRELDSHLVIVIDNSSDAFTRLVRYAESEVVFAAIPSADAIPWIYGTLTIDGPDATGEVVFECSDLDRIDDVFSDIRFIYGTVRRMLHSSDVVMRGKVQKSASNVVFRYTITDIVKLINRS